MKRLLAALLLPVLVSTSADAAFQSFVTIADGRMLDGNGDGTFESLTPGASTINSGLSVRMFNDPLIPLASRFEERSAAEFNLSSLAPTDTVTSVAFRFNTTSYANSNTRVDIYGYVGDGVVSLADATAQGVLLGSYDPVARGLGVQEVTLNLSAFSGLLATTRTVGLRFQGIYPTNTQFDSVESARSFGGNAVAPTLVLNTASVPEPSAALLSGLGLVSVVGVGFARRSFVRTA